MSVVYRTMWEDDRPDVANVARSEFLEWLGGKQIDVDDLARGEDCERAGDGWTVEQVVASEDDHSVLRIRLDEDSGIERWTTTLHVLGDGKGQCVWVDLERVSDEIFDRPPDLGSPRIVRRLVRTGDAHRGNLPLGERVMEGTSNDVEAFVRLLRSPDRTLPIVVFAVGNGQPVETMRQRAQTAAEALCGVAFVCMFPSTAAERLNAALGERLEVRGRSVRTYLPDMDGGPPSKHRFIPASVVERHPRAATNRLTRELFSKAAAERPPKIYRDRIRPMLLAKSGSADDAWEFAHEMERELNDVSTQRDVAVREREVALEDLAQAQREIQDALSRVRYLQTQVVDLGGTEAYSEPPEDLEATVPTSNTEVVGLVAQHLDLIVFDDDIESGTAYLDDFGEAASWAVTAWRCFLALQRYAELSRDGAVGGDFRAVNNAGKLDTLGIPGAWIAMHESQTTRQNDRFRAERTFHVPPKVHPVGQVFMEAHLKIKAGGVPAPRIHFFDDTAGTGKVYVGHYGDHLSNSKTN